MIFKDEFLTITEVDYDSEQENEKKAVDPGQTEGGEDYGLSYSLGPDVVQAFDDADKPGDKPVKEK